MVTTTHRWDFFSRSYIYLDRNSTDWFHLPDFISDNYSKQLPLFNFYVHLTFPQNFQSSLFLPNYHRYFTQRQSCASHTLVMQVRTGNDWMILWFVKLLFLLWKNKKKQLSNCWEASFINRIQVKKWMVTIQPRVSSDAGQESCNHNKSKKLIWKKMYEKGFA